MKRTALPLLPLFIQLLLAIGFSSCVKENLDDCREDEPVPNLILYFEYLDPQGNPLNEDGYEIFATRLQTIDVLIYDAGQSLYQWVTCDDMILNQERRKELFVDPGEYFILGWANNLTHRNDYQELFPEMTLTRSYILHDGSETADPLHYAPDLRGITIRDDENTEIDMEPYQVTVERDKTTEHTLPFMSAHRTLNVYLRGFPEVDNEEEENPVISVSNFTSYYDHFLGRGEETASFTVQSSEAVVYNNVSGDRELLGYVKYYIPHFDNENNITLNIYRPTLTVNQENITLMMTDILEKLEVEVADGDDLVINVLIELSDDGTYVRVKVPDWESVNVGWK